MTHPTELLTAPDGYRVAIDVEMVPLVHAVWRRGIETFTCCQGDDDGRASLGLESLHDADRFYLLTCAGGALPMHLESLRWTLRPRCAMADARVVVEFPRPWLGWLLERVDHHQPIPATFGDFLDWSHATGLEHVEPPPRTPTARRTR